MSRAWRKEDGRGPRRSHLRVLGPALFRSALIRERKTADRSNQPFALLPLRVREHRPFDATKGDAAVASLAATFRDIDVIGWLERDAVLGMILPMVGVSQETV